MAQSPSNRGTTKTTITEIRDTNGDVILEIGLTETRIRLPSGEVVSQRNSVSIRTTDGSIWSPVQWMANPPRHVGICEQCRHPRFSLFRRERASHGIVLLKRAKLCECGVLCCPRHRRRCSDGVWRCLSCAKKHTVKQALLSVFFTREK
jgi:hypothetical protein